MMLTFLFLPSNRVINEYHGFFWLQYVMHPKNISSLPHEILMDIQFTFENDILEKKKRSNLHYSCQE